MGWVYFSTVKCLSFYWATKILAVIGFWNSSNPIGVLQRVRNSRVSESWEEVGMTSEVCTRGQIMPAQNMFNRTYSLHFTGLDVLSITNNSTYFQPNVSVKNMWESLGRGQVKLQKLQNFVAQPFPIPVSLKGVRHADKSIFFSLQDSIVAWGVCWSII